MEIEFKKEYIPLILIALVGIVYMYLALNTAMLGEDEAVYFTMSKEFLNGEYPVFTKTDFPNVFPPLVSLISTVPMYLFGASLSVSKLVIAIFGILTIVVTYLMAKKFGPIAGLSAIAILLSVPLFTQYMFINYMEIPIAFFSILAVYLFLQIDSTKKAVLTGIVLGLSFYAKATGVFLIVAYFLYSIACWLYKRKLNLKLFAVVLLVSLLMILPWMVKNIVLFNYPYVEGLNLLFEAPPYGNPAWLAEALTSLSLNVDYYSTFGYLSIFLVTFGFVYMFLAKEKRLYMSAFLVVLFLLTFNLRGSISIMDPRHLSFILPQIAVIGALILQKLYEKEKKLIVLTIIVVAVAVYSSFIIALGTSSSQRYDQDYVQALTWIKTNTPEDAKIFTAYGGSLSYYAERPNVWTIDEFPEIMTTQDSTYIHDTLEDYDVSYILIWRGIVAENYIIPESNLLGAFTNNFLNVVLADNESFSAAYQNQNNIIFELV